MDRHGWLPPGREPRPIHFLFTSKNPQRIMSDTAVKAAQENGVADVGETVRTSDEGEEVRRTMEYGSFYYDPRNRPISDPHLKRLRESIEKNNRLDKNPIVVGSDGRVYDGQHRLEAAREIGVPIYYRIDDSMEMEDVPRMNRAQKSWTTYDYLNYYAESGNEDYQALRRFTERHPHLSLTFAAELMASGRQRTLKSFRRGEFAIESPGWAETIAEYIGDFFAMGHKFTNKKAFCRAVERVARSDDYDHDRMLQKAERLGMQHQANTKEYLRQFERLFNHHRSERVQLF